MAVKAKGGINKSGWMPGALRKLVRALHRILNFRHLLVMVKRKHIVVKVVEY